MKGESFYMERERDVRLNGVCWKPDKSVQPKAIIQLTHGMAEHILRYETFASYLTNKGYIVYGNDLRGHGASMMAPDDRGFFADTAGFQKVVDDMYALNQIIQENHPETPIVLFGHSMGSFLSRRYIQLYGTTVIGVILSGTGGSQGIIGKIGRLLAMMEAKRIGRRTPSKLMHSLTFGNFNKAFEPARTPFDFLSRDEQEVDDYITDPACGFICTTQFYADLLYGIEVIHREKEIARIPSQLPIYLIAGKEDPVGRQGRGVQEVYEQYKTAGLKNTAITLYPGARHEILHERNKDEVYLDIATWLEQLLQ